VRASVLDLRYTEEAETCVLARFHVVHVPAFSAESEHAVGSRIWLPQPYASAPVTPDQGERDENPVPISL